MAKLLLFFRFASFQLSALRVMPVLLAMLSCSSQSVDDSGGRTNWLVACKEDAACESGSCQGGYCTKPCSEEVGDECDEAAEEQAEGEADAAAAHPLSSDAATSNQTPSGQSSAEATSEAIAIDSPTEPEPADLSLSALSDGGIEGYTATHCLEERAEIVLPVDPEDMAEFVVGDWLYCTEAEGWGEGEVGLQFASDGGFNLIKSGTDGRLKYQPAGTWAPAPDVANGGDQIVSIGVTSLSGKSTIYLQPRAFRDAPTPQWIGYFISSGDIQLVNLR